MSRHYCKPSPSFLTERHDITMALNSTTKIESITFERGIKFKQFAN